MSAMQSEDKTTEETAPPSDPAAPEFGIVANVLEPDRIFRMGAKAWICDGTGGEGWHRFKWRAISRGPRVVEKWAPTLRFHQFRAKWIPPHLRAVVVYVRGARPEMEATALKLEALAAEDRILHPNRMIGRPKEDASDA